MNNKIIIYRHKLEKDIYLIRNWHYCGGGSTTDFYQASNSFLDAIKQFATHSNEMEKGFLSWYHQFPELVAKFTKTLDVEIDDYTGTLKKEVEYPVSDFEMVVLSEPE